MRISRREFSGLVSKLGVVGLAGRVLPAGVGWQVGRTLRCRLG